MKYQKSLKEVLERIIKRWYLVVIAAFVGIAIAYFYNRNAVPSYGVTTTLLYKNSAVAQPVFSDKPAPQQGKRPSLENQVGIISSFSLVLQTLENLKWNATVSEEGLFADNDLFEREPFEVVLDPAVKTNYLSIPFTVTPVSATEYTISANHLYRKYGTERKIAFEGRGSFGKPFKNQYFQFTLNKKAGQEIKLDQDYTVELTDINDLALDYQKKLDIQLADKESDLIYVAVQSKNITRAVAFLNELVKVYVQFGIEEKNRQANNTITFIDNQIYGIRDSLSKASNNLSSYRSQTRAVDINKESSVAIERFQVLNTQESDVRMRIQYYSSLRQTVNDPNSIKNLAAPSVVGVSDPGLNSTILRLSELASQREVLSHTLQEGNPALLSLDKEIQFARNSLAKNLDNLLMNARLELNKLSSQKSSINSQLTTLPKEEQNLVGIQRNFDLNNQLYTFLLQKRAEAGIIKASNFSDVEVLDPASEATARPLGHNSTINLGIGFVLGIVAALLYFLVQTYLDKRIYNIDEVYHTSATKVFGLIYNNKLKTSLPVLQYPQSSITESFRSLRTNIHQFFHRNHQHKVISLNSCVVGEGKTFVTLNLATIFAKNNKKVLLIDTDIRKPKLHRLLGCPNDKGLSDYLRGARTINDIILTTDNSNLHIISAGPGVQFPSELISNGQLEILINTVKEQFDYVILKNAPAGILNDAKNIFPLADLNLFVVKMMQSTGEQIDFINNMAKDFTSIQFGVVINGVRNNLISKEKSFGYYNEKMAQQIEAEMSFATPEKPVVPVKASNGI